MYNTGNPTELTVLSMYMHQQIVNQRWEYTWQWYTWCNPDIKIIFTFENKFLIFGIFDHDSLKSATENVNGFRYNSDLSQEWL
jgi:hypothetical protein